ncbi:MAG: hypothetical protein A2Y38_00695 [Spirochaetes bacterium GWB1_59_5]|nr:MAG: hypothetical protein A2Y38_00695 [Spirochaetes bacterium GWB1_59_5]
MTKKLMLATFLILAMAGTAFTDELELGFGIAPPLNPDENQGPSGNGFFYDNTAVLHVGYSFAWLFYASYDALMLPPASVSSMTGTFDVTNGTYQPGIYRPGVLSLIDVGFRPRIGPVILMVSTGFNNLYIYKQSELEENAGFSPDLGVNLRAGLGFKFGKALSVMASGTVVFNSFDSMITTLEGLGNDTMRDMVLDNLLSNLYPVITINLHL